MPNVLLIARAFAKIKPLVYPATFIMEEKNTEEINLETEPDVVGWAVVLIIRV